MAIIAVEYRLFKPSVEEWEILAPHQSLVNQLAERLDTPAGTLRYGEIQLALLGLLGCKPEEDKSFLVALAGVMGSVAYEVNSMLTVSPGMRAHGLELRTELEEIKARAIAQASVWLEQQSRGVHLFRGRTRYEWSMELIEVNDHYRPERLEVTHLEPGTSFSLRMDDGSTIVATIRDPVKGIVDLWHAPDVLSEGIPSRIGSRTPGEDEPAWDTVQLGDEFTMQSFNSGRHCLTHSIIMLIQMA